MRTRPVKTTVYDWTSLPRDLLVSIAKLTALVSLEDFMAFRATCTTWKEAGGDDDIFRSCVKWPRAPYLMSPDTGEFYSLANQKSFKMKIPLTEDSKGSKLLESRFGWVLTVANSGQAELLYPFSGERIQLPNTKTLPESGGVMFASIPEPIIIRSVLSANPSQTSDYVLAVLTSHYIAFWRPGKQSWTKIESGTLSLVDLIFYSKDDKFYAVTYEDQIWVWDMVRDSAYLGLALPRPPLTFGTRYLVEESSTAELLMVKLFWPYGICRVYRLNVIKREWEPTASLKDAIFVGNNAGFTILPDADDKNIRSNCIYFTGDEYPRRHPTYGDFDLIYMGIYSLEFPQRLLLASYSTSPPLWLAPSSLSFMAPLTRPDKSTLDANPNVPAGSTQGANLNVPARSYLSMLLMSLYDFLIRYFRKIFSFTF